MINYIPIQSPYEVNDLGKAYNRIMSESKSPWVLILDHDVYVSLNPHWYEICLRAANKVNLKVGWITCVTNRIGRPWQKVGGAPKSDNLAEHAVFAMQQFKKGYDAVTDVSHKELSGFFILTNKYAWKTVGGFHEGPGSFYHLDTAYSRALRKHGFKMYVLNYLYVYHAYRNKTFWLKEAEPLDKDKPTNSGS